MEAYYYWSSLAYGILCCVYLFIFNGQRKHHNKWLQLIFKILPLLILFYTGFTILRSNVAPFHIKGPFYIPKVRKVVFSLTLSIIGDAYLVFSSMFVFGLAAFSFAHILLFFAFTEELASRHIRHTEYSILLLLGCISLALYIYIVRKLSCFMKFAAFIYCFLITMMLWAALVHAVKYLSLVTATCAVGALSFYISDIILSINKWKVRIPYADFFIMVTYYVAQYLICYSVVLSE